MFLHFQGGFGNHLFQMAATFESGASSLGYCPCMSSEPRGGTLLELVEEKTLFVGNQRLEIYESCPRKFLLMHQLSLSIRFRAPAVAEVLANTSISNFGREEVSRGDYFISHGYFQNRLPSQESVAALNAILKRPARNQNPGCPEVAVHFRRSGFLGNGFGVLSSDFYARALKSLLNLEFRSLPRLSVFGDPAPSQRSLIEGMRSNFCEIVWQDGSAADDFQQLRNVDYLILSNSTFAYWAALLTTNEALTVFAPSQFYRDQSVGNQKLHPSWISITSDFEDDD